VHGWGTSRTRLARAAGTRIGRRHSDFGGRAFSLLERRPEAGGKPFDRDHHRCEPGSRNSAQSTEGQAHREERRGLRPLFLGGLQLLLPGARPRTFDVDQHSRLHVLQVTLSEISGLKNARKRSSGGDIRSRAIAAGAGDPAKGLIVTMTLDQEPGQTLNADGTVASRLRAAHNIRSEVAVLWQTSRWVVYGVANDEKTGTP
jgi:hypothetical protein